MTVLTVIVVVAGGIAIGAAMNSRSGDQARHGAHRTRPVPMTTFRDPPNGITLEYPRSWKKVEVPVAEYRLALDAGNSVAFTLRVVPIQTPATAQNLQNFKAVTDGLVASNPTVKV